jgi:creatinine amidohydrolase
MLVADMNWMQVEDGLRRDTRCVLPIGSTEQHAYLSLATDSRLAERVARDAAEPLGVPVFPVLAYGVTPAFRAYPGSVTLTLETYFRVLTEILDSLYGSGFRCILIVNGHGGNAPAAAAATEWASNHEGARVRFHSWWNAPRTIAEVNRIDRVASHASWMENFPWTRLEGVAMPEGAKPLLAAGMSRSRTPAEVREYLGDGNFGGRYARPDAELESLWAVAVEETRELLERNWE